MYMGGFLSKLAFAGVLKTGAWTGGEGKHAVRQFRSADTDRAWSRLCAIGRLQHDHVRVPRGLVLPLEQREQFRPQSIAARGGDCVQSGQSVHLIVP
jgi:hypothetical protein